MKSKLALWLAVISISILALPYAVFALHAVVIENMAVAIGADASVGRTFQRDTFWGAGRAWVFYMGYAPDLSTHIYYKSSLDGVNWQPRTLLCDVLDADEFSLFYDGLYVHTTWISNGGLQGGVNYRRGTPNLDGTITWVATQQVYIPSVTDLYVLPTIAVYANKPYIAYGHTVGPTQVWGATSSTQTDGTWIQDAVFENTNLVAGNATVEACIDCLPASGVVHVTIESVVPPAVFPEVGALIYSGGVWQPYETIINSGAFGDFICSTVPWQNKMNVITNFVPGNNISHRQSADGGVWVLAPAATIISLNSYIQATVSIWDNIEGDLKCFFSAGLPNNISWKMYDNSLSTWDAGFFGLDDPVTVNRMNSAQIHSSPLGVVYENDLAPDSDIVYYDWLDSFPPHSASVTNYATLLYILLAIVMVIIAFYTLWMFKTATEVGVSVEEKSNDLVSMAILITVGVIVILYLIYGQG